MRLSFYLLFSMFLSMPVTAGAQGDETEQIPLTLKRMGPEWESVVDENGALLAEPDSQALAFFGREDLIDNHGDKHFCDADAYSDPIAAIVAAAARTRIVIINEAHDTPRHRDFIGDVALALSDSGYHWFAGETLQNQYDSAPPHFLVMAPPAITLRTGGYSAEPVYARMLRDVLEAGYLLVGYEPSFEALANGPSQSVAAMVRYREDLQAESLAAFIDTIPAEDKVLIHVGHSHGRETPTEIDGESVLWMAGRLKELTGIDPLTISQTTCDSQDSSWQLISQAGEEGYDMALSWPEPVFSGHRPGWRRQRGERAVEIPAALRLKRSAVVVEATPVGSAPETVPSDRLLVFPGEEISLLLAPGQYTVQGFVPPATAMEPVRIDVR